VSDSLSCTVVINTYNRAPYLRPLLASLQHLTYRPLEVVVVNGPSTDETQTILDEYKGKIKAVDCPEPNLSMSRNIGINAAAGDIIVFIDDDALPATPDWLERLLAPFADPEVGAVGGPVLKQDTDTYEFRGGWASDYGLQVFTGSDESPGGDRWVRGVRGCNCAFRRSALAEIGGFDEFYSYYLEETDVCHRLTKAGYAIRSSPDGEVRHYIASSSRRKGLHDLNWREITRSDAYFCMKHGRDVLPIRLVKALLFAPRKHYFYQIYLHLTYGHISIPRWCLYMSKWFAGLCTGLAAGIVVKRRTKHITADPPSFVPLVTNMPASRLTICLVSQLLPPDPAAGGVGRYTYDLAWGLHALGHDVHVITRSEQPSRHDALSLTVHGAMAEERLAETLFPDMPILGKNAAYSLAVLDKLINLYNQGIVFDVVHFSNWDAEAIATITARVYPTVMMLVSPLTQVIRSEGWQMNDDLRACVAIDRWQITNADLVCTPSHGVRKTYRDMGIDVDRLRRQHVLPLGLSPAAKVRPAAEPENARKRLLFVGRLERRKGIDVLLGALPALLEQYADWEVDIVGDDTLPDEDGRLFSQKFKARHKGAPFLGRVHFRGRVDEEDLAGFYAACDAFVAPSLFESFGLIYVEAMQHGKPVIGCRTGGIPEVITDGVNGLLAEPGDQASLAAALSRIMGDADLRRTLGEAGRTAAAEDFSHIRMACDAEKIYRELISERVIDSRAALARFEIREVDLGEVVNGEAANSFEERADSSGAEMYIYADQPGAALEIPVEEGYDLNLVFLRHDWGGLLRADAPGRKPEYIDLYSAPSENAFWLRIPVEATNGAATVRLSLHPERNPESHGHEVWLKRAYLTRRARSPAGNGRGCDLSGVSEAVAQGGSTQ
jgi:glycosyltransferase involved in cell wall biosynthesis/GT2 family glycosyltransferase